MCFTEIKHAIDTGTERPVSTVCWCVDYRDLNANTVKDNFPLPNISDCVDALSGTVFFSALDMVSGYYQIELE